jgi:hypothetical protein
VPSCHVCTSPRQSTDEESGLRVNTRFHRLLDPWLLRQQLCNFARKEDADARRSTLMIDATTLTLSTQTINNKTRRRRADQTQTRRPDADAQKPNMSSRNELRRRADCCAAQDNNNKTMQATTNQATPLANHATPLADNHGYASCVHRQQSGHAVRGHGNNNQAARAANPHMATLAVYTANNPDTLSGATATTTRLHAQPTPTWLR